MIKIEFTLDQGLYGEYTEEIIRAILIAGFHGYKTFDPNKIKVSEVSNDGKKYDNYLILHHKVDEFTKIENVTVEQAQDQLRLKDTYSNYDRRGASLIRYEVVEEVNEDGMYRKILP